MWLPCDMEANLQELTSIDNQTLFGIPIQQTWTALYMLEKLCTEQKFDVIIELGTGEGALWKFFRFFDDRALTFDLELGQNIFSLVNQTFLGAVIADNGKAMVFCDDGDKPREIREFSKSLKPGDFILGHDYRRPDGIPENFDYESLGLETYKQDDWDRMKTYILCLRKKQ